MSVIASEALAAWLADKGAQAATRERFDTVLQHWSASALMGKLDRALHDLERPTAAAVADAARRFMDSTDDLDRLFHDLIEASHGDPFFRPPLHPVLNEINSSLVLFNHPLLTIALGVTRPDQLAAKKLRAQGGSVSLSGVVTLYRYITAGGARISLWEAEPIADQFVATGVSPCRFVGHRQLRDGDELTVDGRYQSFTIDHASDQMLFFQAVVRAEPAPVSVEFDSQSCQFLSASGTDEAATRIQMMVSALRCMEREDAVPVLAELLTDAPFYLRWHIMREMLALDAEAAHPWLARMAKSDPHPDVRAAAEQTLTLFFEEPSPGDELCHA